MIDPTTRVAMLGSAIARAQWGRGLATEAARAVLAWAFAEHDLVEIWASTQVDNVRSQRVMVKLGMELDPSDTREVRYTIHR
jgi:ribosomal-protein-alanine N-acetyltransferase